VYGISKDSIKSHQGFVSKQNLNFILLSDKESLAQIAFGAEKEDGKTQRSTFLINPKGHIAHVWPKVSVKGHVAEVLTKLKDLQ
ncbi:MAG: peroxiredoxin, partial [Alphaproteobacteria bacterium]|nr:peroxiredoxin [Alphaproteobacteria bacterium]